MGKRVHVARNYKVEYGDTEAFNWKQDEFISVLETLGCDICRYDNEDNSAGEFEVNVTDYNDAVENLECHIGAPGLFVNADDISHAIESTGMTDEKLLKTMKNYLQEADTHDGYLHFAAF